jgi:hypothetical protein
LTNCCLIESNSYRCKQLLLKSHLKVVDVEFAQDEEKKWDGSRSFDNIPKKKVPVEDLHPLLRKLLDRLLTEIDIYFPTPNKHQLIAMMVDPVMLSVGLPWLRLAGHGDVVDQAKSEFKRALIKESERVWKQDAPPAQVDPPQGDDEDADSDDDVYQTVVRKSALPVDSDAPDTVRQAQKTAEEIADQAYREWTMQVFDWAHFLKHDQRLVLSAKDNLKVAHGDCFFMAEQVDILLWFRLYGKRHSMVSRIAAPELAAPDANGLQERVFSFCRLIDTHMRQSLGAAKFEMLTLLAFNKDFVKSTGEAGPLSMSSVLGSLRSATSAKAAAALLTEFFDLDYEDAEDDAQGEEGTLADSLKRAADAIDEENASKRRNH